MSTSQGQEAETAVDHYLRGRGYEILARNWNNQWREIDIVSRLDDVVHFVKVKYRKNTRYGSGFDCIDNRKITRLKKAAPHWVKENDWSGDYIDAASVDGATGEISYIENAVIAP